MGPVQQGGTDVTLALAGRVEVGIGKVAHHSNGTVRAQDAVLELIGFPVLQRGLEGRGQRSASSA